MYDKNDKSAAILELQRYLSLISDNNNDMPHVSIDGVYGENTALAVKSIQKMHGISESGKTDHETFLAIYNLYTSLLKDIKTKKNTYNHEIYPLKTDDFGSEVSVLNIILRELSQYYDLYEIEDIEYYSEKTELSIKIMQQILGEEISGMTDYKFINQLQRELHARDKFKNTI